MNRLVSSLDSGKFLKFGYSYIKQIDKINTKNSLKSVSTSILQLNEKLQVISIQQDQLVNSIKELQEHIQVIYGDNIDFKTK